MMSSEEMELIVDNRQLPVGWEIKKLGEVYDVRDGTHDSPKYLPEGYALITSKNLKSNGLNFENIKYISEVDYKKINERSAVHKGDILLAMIGTIGNPIVVEVEPEFAIKNVALIKVSKKQSSYFLKYYLETEYVRSKMQREAKGTTQKFVGLGYLRDFPIPIPPLPEQKRIVAIADEAFEGIDRAIRNTEKNLSNARELFESYLNTIFTQKGDGWEEKKLDEECEIIMGQSPDGSSYNAEGIGVPLINGPVEFGGIEPFSKTVATKFTTKPTKMCKEGDLILCVRGSTTGRMNIAGQEACIGRGVAAIVSKNNQDWVNQFISFSRNKIYALGSGSTFPNVSSSELKKIIIPFPPKEQQDHIVSQIEYLSTETQRLENIYRQKIAALKELKQSILQKAFTGELTADKGEK
ncbi:restriction endonuclease subunit S [Dolichospermum lemmermannii CS-548]|uniref:restriction endonuclease subunit S n=1 Tax=Dolichospermum lemmermannii TaxID=54295 RepID=UPI00232B0594|nr:restriction endonuclease subunit S [Dolichospermum lemmermannii]MDB9439731.1 restriction endonuclease subunit S [Dolichospermum lemmermannii CS-548]